MERSKSARLRDLEDEVKRIHGYLGMRHDKKKILALKDPICDIALATGCLELIFSQTFKLHYLKLPALRF